MTEVRSVIGGYGPAGHTSAAGSDCPAALHAERSLLALVAAENSHDAALVPV